MRSINLSEKVTDELPLRPADRVEVYRDDSDKRYRYIAIHHQGYRCELCDHRGRIYGDCVCDLPKFRAPALGKRTAGLRLCAYHQVYLKDTTDLMEEL